MILSEKLNWRLRLVVSVFTGVALIIALLFGITYQYFRNKLMANDEEIAHLSFQQAEENLKQIVLNAERALSRFSFEKMAWDFSVNRYINPLDKNIAGINIVSYFDEIINMNDNLYGVAIVSGDGRMIASTAQRRSGTGQIEITSRMRQLMEKGQEDYPFVNWSYGEQLNIAQDSPFWILTTVPVFIGVRALGESEQWDQDSYLIVAIEESDIQKTYEQLAYNESQVVLLDSGQEIISATDDELLGTVFTAQDSNQNIMFDLGYNGWRLINIIDKKNYALESRDIQYFMVTVGAIALSFVLAVFIIWSRKYTRPIQNLMEQMDRVGQEQLEIPRPDRMGWQELDKLNQEFYMTVQKLKGYIHKLQEVEQEKSREELRALQYQINPHFLYNSLNSIRWMAMMTNNTKVADSLVILSKIINPILRNPSFTWNLQDELEFIENYVDMMRIRYGSYMEFELNCPEEWYEEIFPRFVLQPVIENCFVHGKVQPEVHRIGITIEKKELFGITVTNNGGLLEEAELERVNQALARGEKTGNSIGLNNVQKRLRLLYGERGRIWLESRETVGVIVHIVF